MWKFVKNPVDKKAAELISASKFRRPFIAPPGIPEPLKTLRDAFAKTMADPEFKADAENTCIDVVPTSGEKVQQLVEELYATPKATVERAKDLVKP